MGQAGVRGVCCGGGGGASDRGFVLVKQAGLRGRYGADALPHVLVSLCPVCGVHCVHCFGFCWIILEHLRYHAEWNLILGYAEFQTIFSVSKLDFWKNDISDSYSI